MKHFYKIFSALCLLLSFQHAQAQSYTMSSSPITTCSGTHRDPGGINNYGNGLNITQVISPATAGSKVRLSFTAFHLEDGWDFLTIYDGPSASSPALGTFTGTTISSTITATNSTGQLTLVFSSDISDNTAGWTATISCISSSTGVPMTSSALTGCSGTWQDPGGNADYGHNLDITQTITPSTAGSKLRITFTSFDVESGWDFLEIYDGTSATGTPVATYTGSAIPAAITATNASGALTFKFTSDFTGAGAGWTATVSCITSSSDAMTSTPRTTCSGTWQDPGGNADYGMNLDITQTISPATTGSKARVTFNSFSLEDGYDYLVVYDGPNTTSPLINIYTGSSSPGTITASNATGQLTFRFISDNIITASGWTASISCVTTAGPGVFSMTSAQITTCNATWYDPAGSSSSFFYGNNNNVTQTISPATAGSKVRITFNAFSLENNADFLYVYNGPDTSSPLLATLTGTTTPAPITSTATGGQLTFRFTSNASVGAAGWASTISCFTPPPPAITSFTPASGPVGTTVTITGTNFTGATAVTINGTTGTHTVNSATQITFTIPAGATTGPIAVTTPTGTGTSSTNFTVTLPCITPSASISTACTSAASQTISIALTGNQPWTVNYTINGSPQTASGITASPHVITVTPTASTTYVLTGVSSGTCTGTASGSVTVSPKVTPTVTGNSGCANTRVNLTASGAPTGGSYKWYTAATGGTAISGATSAVYQTPILTATTTYNVSVENAQGCEGPRVAVTATINPVPTVNAGANQTVCTNVSPVTLSGFSPAGGTWSGTGVSSGGVFTPTASMSGAITLTYSVTQNGCTATDTKTITVNAAPTVNAGSAQTVCANAAPVTLTGFSPAGGTWSGNGVSAGGVFTPTAALIGTQTLTYTVTSGSCTSSATKTITVNALPTVNAGADQTVCANATPVTLTGFSPTGGTWSGTGISSGGVFTPTASMSGAITLTYSVTQNGCTATDTKIITVNAAPTVNAGSAQTVCANAAAFQLTGFSPTGGTWTGNGVSTTGLFTPSASLAGAQSLTYTVTANGCTNSATRVVTVTPAPTVNAGANQTVCANAAPVTLSGFSPAGGTWSGTGVTSGGVFTPTASMSGAITLTYSVTQNGCTATDTKTITITPAPTVNAGTNQTVCANAAAVTLTGFSPAGGTWSGNGVSAGGVFTPTAALIGTQTLTYTVTSGSCTSSATKTITVNALPTVNAGADQTVCANASPVTLTGFSPAGGTWSGTGVTAGGVFTPTASMPGTVTLTYTVTQSGCTATGTKIITLNAAPTVNAGTNQTVCANAAPVTLTGFSPAGGTWSGVGVSPTGTFNPSAAGAGTFTLTYSVTVSGCIGTANKTMTVNGAPATPTINVLPNNELESSVSGATYEWRHNTVLLPFTTRSITATANGTYTVKVTGTNSCVSTESAGLNYVLTGINDLLTISILNVFPNPANGKVTVKLEGFSNKASVKVVNLLGQEILSDTLDADGNAVSKVLELGTIAKGVYLVRVTAGEQTITKKLIVE